MQDVVKMAMVMIFKVVGVWWSRRPRGCACAAPRAEVAGCKLQVAGVGTGWVGGRGRGGTGRARWAEAEDQGRRSRHSREGVRVAHATSSKQQAGWARGLASGAGSSAAEVETPADGQRAGRNNGARG
jgi:hypothetical protein